MVDSISKTPVSFDQAGAVVARAFGADARLTGFTPCEEGWFNAVHRLELADGTGCVLKVAPPPDVRVLRYEHDLITTEVEALRLVAARTGVPVPAVLAWDDSCDLLPSPYFLMARCPGTLWSELRPQLDADQQAAVDDRVVRLVATMNEIPGVAFGRPDRTAPRHATWSAAFADLVAGVLADAADAEVDLPAPADEVRTLVASGTAALDAVTAPSFVHWDVWDPNVFVDPDTLDVVGLIDFERVLWADPLMEAQFAGKRAADRVVEAYGRDLFAEPGAVERRRLYDLYLFLVMTVECSYRNYPTDDIERFARPMLDSVLAELRSG